VRLANSASLALLDLGNFTDTVGSLRFSGPAQVAANAGRLTLNSGVTMDAGFFTAIITADLSLGSATRTFTIGQGFPGQALTVSGHVSGASGAGITKAGAGELVLSNSNTYSGTTQIQQGVLSVANDSALGSTAAGTVVNSGAALTVKN